MLVFRLAFRNLLLQRAKTFTIGAFLVFGTILILVGNSLLDALDDSMAQSIIRSITGHLQVHSADAEDELVLFGMLDIGQKDYGVIPDFQKVRNVLENEPEIRRVVPMGSDNAVVFTGNILDQRLSELRTTLTEGKSARSETLAAQIRRMINILQTDWKRSKELIDVGKALEKGANELQHLDRGTSDAFWESFSDTPYEHLEFLENKIAPLALDADLIWIGYIGTDMRDYEETFSGFEIAQGTSIPPGKRGFLFNTLNYERQVKNKTARRLDEILQKLDDEILYEECEDCHTWAKQNREQVSALMAQLDQDSEPLVREGLQKALGSDEEDLKALMTLLFTHDGTNFRSRHTVFYDVLAPHISLYSIPIGSTLTITAYGRGGYVRKVPVKVYGTYRFRSMDGEAMAGGFNLMDLMTFRDLYGYMTDERREEITDLRKEAAIDDFERGEVEDALFGGDDEDGAGLVEEGTSTTFEAQVEGGALKFDDAFFNTTYSREEMASGAVLNAAIMLEDGISVEDGQRAVQRVIEAEKLGIQVTSWRSAAGLWGDFIKVVQGVLHGAVFIIFLVALLIINNTLMMSTLERTREIGTMRAIGAQRSFVRKMIFAETGMLALFFGGVGALLGSGIVVWLTAVGIPPWNDVTRFFFAGGNLHPEWAFVHVLAAVAAIAFVSILATVYPVSLATRITPLVAMQSED